VADTLRRLISKVSAKTQNGTATPEPQDTNLKYNAMQSGKTHQPSEAGDLTISATAVEISHTLNHGHPVLPRKSRLDTLKQSR
jgi:hypothetical protein